MTTAVAAAARWLLPAACVAAIAVAGHFSRYTWWSFTLFGLYNALVAIGPHPPAVGRPLVRTREWFFASNAVLVMVGVVVMACMAQESSLLVRSNREYGSFVYGVGTYALHYFPALVTVSGLQTGGGRRYEKTVLAAAPAVLFTLYCVVENPVEVYGVPLSVDVAMGLGGAYAVAAAAVAWWANTDRL